MDEFHLKRMYSSPNPWLTTNHFLDKLDRNLRKASA
jgi:hypothetical protein